MKAAVRDVYGPPEVIRVEELPKPKPGPDDVLLRVVAVSVNASDWECLTGTPAYGRIWGFFNPTRKVLGSDVAGIVEAVGENVSEFRPGDEVFGDVMGPFGGFAEYAAVPARLLRHKPEELSFEHASTLLQSAVIALQGVSDDGKLQAGQHILINGGGGGSGTLAIQLAKSLGAEVTAVDNHRKLDLMRSLGADHVLDYAEVDFTKTGESYDLILDLFATHSPREVRRALRPRGRYLAVGGHTRRILQLASVGRLYSLFGKRVGVLSARQNEGVERMCELVRKGTLRPIIDRTFSLEQTADAIRYLGEGKALGKVIVKVAEP